MSKIWRSCREYSTRTLGRRSRGFLAGSVQKVLADSYTLQVASDAPGLPKHTEGIFLAGYGALFLTEVDYSLTPAPNKHEKAEKEEVEESVWEQAGGRNPWTARSSEQLWRCPRQRFSRASRKEYDEKKIEQLQESLLTALKHATNIRSLAPEDTVTVVVQGRGHALQV